jgi:hypothetical protein
MSARNATWLGELITYDVMLHRWNHDERFLASEPQGEHESWIVIGQLFGDQANDPCD